MIGLLFGAGDRDLDLMIGSYGPVFCMAAKKYLKEGGREFCVSAEFEPEMQCILVDFEPNVVLFIVSEGHFIPFAGRSPRARPHKEDTSVVFRKFVPSAGRSPRARPHKEDTSVASQFQGGIGAEWSASVQTLGRLLAKCLAQQTAQYASHVVPLLPHSWQKTFTFMRQLLSFMSAHV